ncbi:hypothetical protein T484DRAFT_1743773 [Baffinella frigidus]|nr:hypothetical protein T484DRAFT_1743773 [Cryptophyta sp. CCMP2293]
MMLPRSEKGGRSRARGPESVPCHMWLLWCIINGYLAYRVLAPAKAMMPAGERVELGSEPKVPEPAPTHCRPARGKHRGPQSASSHRSLFQPGTSLTASPISATFREAQTYPERGNEAPLHAYTQPPPPTLCEELSSRGGRASHGER